MAVLDLVLVNGLPLGSTTEDAVLEFIENNEICTIEIEELETLRNGDVKVKLSPLYEDDNAQFNEFVMTFMEWLYA